MEIYLSIGNHTVSLRGLPIRKSNNYRAHIHHFHLNASFHHEKNGTQNYIDTLCTGIFMIFSQHTRLNLTWFKEISSPINRCQPTLAGVRVATNSCGRLVFSVVSFNIPKVPRFAPDPVVTGGTWGLYKLPY